MRDPSINPLICFIDPVSASILALGSAAGGAASALPSILNSGGSATPPSPTAAPPPAPPIQQPQGTKNGAAAVATAPGGAGQPSFVGSSSLPQQSGYGAKTLLGQ